MFYRAWCMDRTLSQSRKYIASSLGAKYAEPVITLLDMMHSESRPNTPMICFLSIGSDPTPNIEQLAKRLEIVCRSVSMGQGQEVHARRLLNSAKTEVYDIEKNCFSFSERSSLNISLKQFVGFLGFMPELSFRLGVHDGIGKLSFRDGSTSSKFPCMDYNGTAQRFSRFLVANVYKIYIRTSARYVFLLL